MYTLSACELHKRFCDGTVSAQEIANYFLKRIEVFDPQLGAFLSVFSERVLAQAASLDQKRAQGKPLGRLAAVPIAIKDNIHVKGEKTTCASKFLENYTAVFDATVTALMEQEDALIIGKTNLDEFAMGSSTENSALLKTSNPWDLSRVPGGSSGGSAVAVAARLCPLSLGSDTGGSVRQPASFCGVIGYKPTYGRVSRFGLVAFGSSLDQIGPFAGCTEDIGMLMQVIGTHDPKDATSYSGHREEYLATLGVKIQGKKIGVPWAFLENLNSDAKKCFLEALNALKDLGCEIVDINLNSLKYSIATYYIIATAEASTNLARFDGVRYGVRSTRATNLEQIYDYSRTEGFGAEVKKRIMLGTYVLSSGYQDAYYKQAAKVRTKIIEEFDQAFTLCDCIATPVSPFEAFQKGAIHDPIEMYLQDIYTIGVNLAGLPAIAIPSGTLSNNLPFGLQLIGAKKQDVHVCEIAYAYEKHTQHATRIAPLFNREV